jgi:hypothetical protein
LIFITRSGLFQGCEEDWFICKRRQTCVSVHMLDVEEATVHNFRDLLLWILWAPFRNSDYQNEDHDFM